MHGWYTYVLFSLVLVFSLCLSTYRWHIRHILFSTIFYCFLLVSIMFSSLMFMYMSQLQLYYTVAFCVLKKWVHSRIGQCGRPAVNPITLHNHIQLSWNFVHRIVSSISRSSSKMRMIRQKMTELSKKLSSLTRPSLRGGVQGFCQKKNFSQNYSKHIYKSTQFLTLIPNMILVLNQTVVF
jgi:hypothetical protein